MLIVEMRMARLYKKIILRFTGFIFPIYDNGTPANRHFRHGDENRCLRNSGTLSNRCSHLFSSTNGRGIVGILCPTPSKNRRGRCFLGCNLPVCSDRRKLNRPTKRSRR